MGIVVFRVTCYAKKKKRFLRNKAELIAVGLLHYLDLVIFP